MECFFGWPYLNFDVRFQYHLLADTFSLVSVPSHVLEWEYWPWFSAYMSESYLDPNFPFFLHTSKFLGFPSGQGAAEKTLGRKRNWCNAILIKTPILSPWKSVHCLYWPIIKFWVSESKLLDLCIFPSKREHLFEKLKKKKLIVFLKNHVRFLSHITVIVHRKNNIIFHKILQIKLTLIINSAQNERLILPSWVDTSCTKVAFHGPKIWHALCCWRSRLARWI